MDANKFRTSCNCYAQGKQRSSLDGGADETFFAPVLILRRGLRHPDGAVTNAQLPAENGVSLGRAGWIQHGKVISGVVARIFIFYQEFADVG